MESVSNYAGTAGFDHCYGLFTRRKMPTVNSGNSERINDASERLSELESENLMSGIVRLHVGSE